MSRIYFHSPSGEKEIYGPERAWMGYLTADIAAAVLIGAGYGTEKLLPFLPADAFPREHHRRGEVGWGPKLAESLRLWMRQDQSWIVDDESLNCWELGLNTVLAIGSDPLKLCARLHAQCEIHCYCEGPDRTWLAGIIRDGIRSSLMRDGGYGPPNHYGKGQWSDLAIWLEARDDEPVVCSYSVCDQFPNRHIAGWEDDSDGDRWYELDGDERWRLAMDRARQDCPRLQPDGWADYRFGHNRDAFWLLAQASDHDRASVIPPR